jgi:hypothetical protein
LKTGSAIPLFLLVNPFLGFAQNPFEKLQADIYHFSKDFCANLRNLSTNRKKEIKIQKRIVHPHPLSSKAFGEFKSFRC